MLRSRRVLALVALLLVGGIAAAVLFRSPAGLVVETSTVGRQALFRSTVTASGEIAAKRRAQDVKWMWALVHERLHQRLTGSAEVRQLFKASRIGTIFTWSTKGIVSVTIFAKARGSRGAWDRPGRRRWR